MIASTLEPWSGIAATQDDALGLAESALVIAQEEYATLDVAAYVRRLTELADRVGNMLEAGSDTFAAITALNRCLFEEEGFSGNAGDYYDPRNSYLNEVMDRRLGIPITLCVIYLDVAERLDLPVVGVGFPGHFLVKWRVGDGNVVIDPFARGDSLGVDQLNRLLRRVYGDDAPSIRDCPALLGAVGKKDILARILRNLKRLYLDRGDRARALSAIDRILLLDPDSFVELGDRARVYESSECYRSAITDLERMRAALDARANRKLADEIEESLRRLRCRASSYH